jgi:hypothetical protein
MPAKLRTELRSPSPSFVIACLALFVALGGTSIAAVSLKRNSVKGTHIAANAVTSPKVRDGGLFARDFANGQLPAGAPGSRGDQGAPGADGAPGTPGAAGTPAPNYSAGPGLMLASNVFSADFNSVQARITGTCPGTQKVLAVNANGTVNCAGDTDTGVNAVVPGTGITASIASRQLNIATSSSVQLRTAASPLSCPAGQFLRAVAQDGAPTCAIP